MSNLAVLSYNQFQEFVKTGVIPEFFVNQTKIPAYAMESWRSKWRTKEYKLFPENVTKEDLWYIYTRMDIAANAVDIPAEDAWGKGWQIRPIGPDGKDVENDALVQRIWQINRDLRVQSVFKEAHQYARAVGVGIVVMGLADGAKTSEPVRGSARGITYLVAFSSMDITKINYVKDVNDPKYGDIESYEIDLGTPETRFTVHADRAIHVMQMTKKRSAWGRSILESSYDLFQVLKNTDWSAGESYFQNASPLYVMSWEDVGEEVEPPAASEIDEVKEDLEDLHVRKRFIKPASWSLEVVKGSGQLPDPGMIWEPVIERISGGCKVPKQILLGTSAGALASGEVNLQQYYKDIASMQTHFCEPLLIEFYTRLQDWGVLPEGSFDIVWNPLWETSEKDRADIWFTKARAASLLAGNPLTGVPPLMTVEEIRENVLGVAPEMGGGRRVMLTQAAGRGRHPLGLDNEVERLFMTLRTYADQVRDGLLTEEDALSEGEKAIKEAVGIARRRAQEFAAARLGRDVGELSPEQLAMFAQLEAKYLADFKRTLEDVES